MQLEPRQDLTREFHTEILTQSSRLYNQPLSGDNSPYRYAPPAMPAGYSVLEHLKDFEINPDVEQRLTRKLVKQQVYDFMNIYRHADRVLPKWNSGINLKTVGVPKDGASAESFSAALNHISLMTNVNVSHHQTLKVENQGFGRTAKNDGTNTNALMIFVDGKEQICLDDNIREALTALGKDPVDVYNRIDQNCVTNRQATEYRSLRYDSEGVTFFLYIVDTSWVRKMELESDEHNKAMHAQFMHAAFRLFSLQDGVSDTVKYSFMNHKYFWKNMQNLAPVDIAFLTALYSKVMQKKRSKYKSTRYLAHLVWKTLKPQ